MVAATVFCIWWKKNVLVPITYVSLVVIHDKDPTRLSALCRGTYSTNLATALPKFTISIFFSCSQAVTRKCGLLYESDHGQISECLWSLTKLVCFSFMNLLFSTESRKNPNDGGNFNLIHTRKIEKYHINSLKVIVYMVYFIVKGHQHIKIELVETFTLIEINMPLPSWATNF